MPLPLTQPSTAVLDDLRGLAGEGGWEDPGPDSRYLLEPRDRVKGRAALVLRPDSTEILARMVEVCARHRIGVIPWSGGTGLVGGQVADLDPEPVVISLERMRQVREILDDEAAMVVEAGCPLAQARAAAEERGWTFPLRIASEGECRIGGNLATNAGGTQVLRYGNARELCLGVEAVMADGRIWSDLRPLRKNNTGYDLRGLLIGSEGTLGIIAAATLRIVPKSAEVSTALVAARDVEAAVRMGARIRRGVQEVLSTLELIDRTGVDFVAEHFPEVKCPIDPPYPWYVLVEAEGGKGSQAQERMEASVMEMIESGEAADAVVAQSESQRQDLHTLREVIPLTNRRVGAVATHDVAVPLARVAELVRAVQREAAAVEPRLRTNIFGHLGDGNLHANVFPPAGESRDAWRDRRGEVSERVFRAVREMGGTISAEHGVGRFLRERVEETEAQERIDAMRAIKRAMDPEGIFNPGAVVSGGEG